MHVCISIFLISFLTDRADRTSHVDDNFIFQGSFLLHLVQDMEVATFEFSFAYHSMIISLNSFCQLYPGVFNLKQCQTLTEKLCNSGKRPYTYCMPKVIGTSEAGEVQ